MLHYNQMCYSHDHLLQFDSYHRLSPFWSCSQGRLQAVNLQATLSSWRIRQKCVCWFLEEHGFWRLKTWVILMLLFNVLIPWRLWFCSNAPAWQEVSNLLSQHLCVLLRKFNRKHKGSSYPLKSWLHNDSCFLIQIYTSIGCTIEAHSITPTQSVCKACHVAQIKAYHHSIPLLAAQEVVDGKVVSYFTHK